VQVWRWFKSLGRSDSHGSGSLLDQDWRPSPGGRPRRPRRRRRVERRQIVRRRHAPASFRQLETGK